MFELVSEDRQRKSTVLQIIRKSVPSGRAGVAECPFHPPRRKIVCMQFSFPSDHGGRKIGSDMLTYPSVRAENNINAKKTKSHPMPVSIHTDTDNGNADSYNEYATDNTLYALS